MIISHELPFFRPSALPRLKKFNHHEKASGQFEESVLITEARKDGRRGSHFAMIGSHGLPFFRASVIKKF
jgi:hypothetical protein